MRILRICALFLLALLAAAPLASRAAAYSLLTHEELIDLTWQDSIVPLLLSHYPGLNAAQLSEARAYAYGGCVIQDMGYYPFGDRSFSNLTHYVRTGDFVLSLFRNAHNADELAFAIGALSHYIGDSIGHSRATNLAVPVEFPRLGAQYGPVVSYAEGKYQHVQTEFAFDINGIHDRRMAPVHFLRHVGLRVSVRQLALAFYQTYGITENFSVLRGRRFNVSGYRFAVRAFIPRIAYALTLLHRGNEPPEIASAEARELDVQVAAVATANDWDHYRRKAGIGTHLLAMLIFILPKIGPLKLVAVKGPTQATETEYIHSVLLSENALRLRLERFTPPAARHWHGEDESVMGPLDSRHPLPNCDLDTGRVVQPGGYSLTDKTYASLLHKLVLHPQQPIPPGIKADIQAYYANPNAPITTKKNPKHWAQVQADLETLAAMPTSTEAQPYPTYAEDAAAAAK
ncbi:MAG TPA: zinc dependent phospholipase C family protein [Terracidiphilus sp.]|nr:zinc dependent phospholipase C family protein [Terracidiphilus sp.]